ncbi:DUF563 domain-containing protein [Microbacterium sp. 179-B 1A2 NHS]|uniref:glycosyltransferase family 61 protein n=1 Tax=Microbacterium sp. 179-B 1A2 NHS TaxID=3142383 RepID=UPI0039A07EDF
MSLARPDHAQETYDVAAGSPRMRGRRALVVLVASTDRDVDPWRDRFADQNVRVLWTGDLPKEPKARAGDAAFADSAALRELLRRMPPVDCFVDLRTATHSSRVELWGWAYYFLRPGGLYVVSAPTARAGRQSRAGASTLAAWVSGAAGSVSGFTEAELKELTAATARSSIRADLSWFRRRRAYAVTVTERDADEVLPQRLRKASHEVLLTLPGGRFESPAVVDHHEPARMPRRVESVLDVPPMTLRRYEGDIGFHGHMAFSVESTVLPSSFRYPWGNAKYLMLPHQPFSAHQNTVYRLRDASKAPLLPDAEYVDLTHPFHGHFGHLIAQTVARLWALDEIEARYPDARFLLPEPTASIGRDRRPYEMLFAAGVPRDRVTWVSKPARLRRLIVPSLGLQYSPSLFVHPAVAETWSRMREQLVEVDPSSPRKIFVSRRYGVKKRGCRNASAVDQLFEDHGFTVVYPEDHPLEGQAKLFGNARVIAGFGGSGMYNSIFADHLDAMIILNSQSYSGRTEHLIGLTKADRVDYFWNPPLESEGADYTSPWEFDFNRNGGALRALLASL